MLLCHRAVAERTCEVFLRGKAVTDSHAQLDQRGPQNWQSGRNWVAAHDILAQLSLPPLSSEPCFQNGFRTKLVPLLVLAGHLHILPPKKHFTDNF